MSHYLITGGTGLIGSAMCKHLISNQHNVTVLSRQPENVAKLCGNSVKAISSLEEIDKHTNIEGVINLAGAPIADRPWSKKRKKVLEQSRIGLTSKLVNWITQRELKPDCLISGSAIGWYGDCGDEILTENSDYHDEYTHQLCSAWENQALQVQNLGVRICIVRTGLVLAANGGFLKKMILPFKMGLGGKLSHGQQYMSWIHLNDLIRLLQFLLDKKNESGIFNACSPSPVTNKEFSQTLAKQLHRPAFLPAPAWLIKLILGEMSQLLLTGQRVLPQKARALGFQFDYTELNTALADILSSK